MDRLISLLMLVPALPLVGAFWNRAAVFLCAAIGFAAFTAAAVLTGDPIHHAVLAAGLPFLFLSSGAALHFVRRKSDGPDSLAGERESLERLRARHAALRQDVAHSEKEEAVSLQIYGVSKALAEAISWKDLAPRLTAGIQKLFGAFEFLIYSIDREGRWTPIHRRGSWSHEPPVKKAVPDSCTFLFPPQVAEVVPVLTVPIYLSLPEGRRMNGVLFLKTGTDERMHEELRRIGDEVGQQLGMALNKAMLFTQMENHSRFDGLTGALRRQAFMDRLEEELKRASVFHTPFSVMMVDIDFFKAVNDTHGHAAGDTVLARVGAILRECFYETDVVGRYGGEEFIILLPRAEAEGVLRKAESLRQRLEREEILFGFEKLKVTVSVGVAHFPQAGRTAEDLIGRADKALYSAKEGGRNRVVAASAAAERKVFISERPILNAFHIQPN